MDAPTLRTVAKLEAAAKALSQLAQVGAEAYANGGHRAEPIVAQHFTPGNQERYGWAPLSPSYAARKAAGLVHASGGFHYLKPEARKYVEATRARLKSEREANAKPSILFGASAASMKAAQAKTDADHLDRMIAFYAKGRRGSKLDRTQTAKVDSLIFGASNVRAEANLPMLVLTGKLREAVLSRQHPIRVEGDTALISFIVPDYAHYLQDGTSKMPARSPVDPNESDAAQVRAEMQKYLDASLGTARSIGVTRAVPPAARATEAR